MNWSQRYANDMGTPDGDTGAPDDGLSTMATDLNSHIFSYTGQSGQSPTDRMYKGNKGADLDNQPWLTKLLSKYNKSSTGAIGKAVQQIKLFTGKDSYNSDIRTNREKFPEFHKLMDQAGPIAGGLSRGTVLTDVRHGTPGSPIDISQHYKVGDKMTTQVTSATSDPNLAKSWVLDDKQRFDKAKDTGDNSVLDTKYDGARYGAFVVQHFPAGIKGLQVAPLSAVPEHNEVVPQAGQKLRVSKVTGPDESGVHHVYYEHDTERVASWNERYTKEAFKIKFWERGDNWNKLLKDSPYQNLSEPAPSFTIIEPGYQCELCGTKKHPEDVFRDKNNDNYYCKSHYSLPKVDTFNVQDNAGNIVSKGKDTREISRKVREQTGKLYQLDKKRKEKELKSNQPKEYVKPLDAIFASRYAASKRVHDELTSVLPEGW